MCLVAELAMRYGGCAEQVKVKNWEKRLIDETNHSNVSELKQMAQVCEEQYLRSLPCPGTCHRQTPIKGYSE